jgi:hypothetical protein
MPVDLRVMWQVPSQTLSEVLKASEDIMQVNGPDFTEEQRRQLTQRTRRVAEEVSRRYANAFGGSKEEICERFMEHFEELVRSAALEELKLYPERVRENTHTHTPTLCYDEEDASYTCVCEKKMLADFHPDSHCTFVGFLGDELVENTLIPGHCPCACHTPESIAEDDLRRRERFDAVFAEAKAKYSQVPAVERQKEVKRDENYEAWVNSMMAYGQQKMVEIKKNLAETRAAVERQIGKQKVVEIEKKLADTRAAVERQKESKR